MFEYLIDNKTVIFNSPEELNIGIAEAEEKGKTRPNNKATEGCCLLLAP